MNVKKILLFISAATMAMTLIGCNKTEFGDVVQGRTIAFDKDKKEVTLIKDSSTEPGKPSYDILPPVIYKMPVDPNETGQAPKTGMRMKLDTIKKQIVIYDNSTQKLETLPISIVDIQQPIEKDHPLVYDKQTKEAKKFPVIDSNKKTITVYSGRQKMLCTFSVPEAYFDYPVSTWDAGDEVRIYYKTPGQSSRFMNVTKTDIFKK